MEFLAVMNQHSIHGRYPEPDRPEPSAESVARTMEKTEEMLSWLIGRL